MPSVAWRGQEGLIPASCPAQVDFPERGERAWQNYLKTGVSIPAVEVFARLEKRIEARRRELLKKP